MSAILPWNGFCDFASWAYRLLEASSSVPKAHSNSIKSIISRALECLFTPGRAAPNQHTFLVNVQIDGSQTGSHLPDEHLKDHKRKNIQNIPILRSYLVKLSSIRKWFIWIPPLRKAIHKNISTFIADAWPPMLAISNPFALITTVL